NNKFFNFGVVQVPMVSEPEPFVIVNNADRLNDCPIKMTGGSASQFHLSNPADTLHHFTLPYASDTINVTFQPSEGGLQEAYLRAGSPGTRDSVRLWGTGQGTGTVLGQVTTTSGTGVDSVKITVHQLDPPYADFITYTGPDGSYTKTNVGYCQVRITPSKTLGGINHSFNPVSTIKSLSSVVPSGTANFTDVSTFPVSGHVTYKTSTCPSGGIPILVDNVENTTTDSTGYYATTALQAGIHTIKPAISGGHTFEPASFTDTILFPVSGVNFQDKFTHNLHGHVRGGNGSGCGVPLDDSVKLTITSLKNCKPLVSIYTDSTGYFSTNLPPFKYIVVPADISYQDTLIRFPSKLVDLQSRDTVQDFIYHSPPVIFVSGFAPYTNSHGWTILEQFKPYTLGIDVYEPYIDPAGDTILCRVNTGEILIFDDLSDMGQDTLALGNSTTHYAFHAGLPNIMGGGDHPYQKRLEIQFIKEGKTIRYDKWVYIVGQRPRKAAFTTTTPEIPLLILRDPPGDESSSYFSQTTEVSQAISFAMKHETSSGDYLKVSLGVDFEFQTGFMFSTGTKIDVTLDFTAGVNMTMSQNSVTENQLTMSTTQSFNTSDDEAFIGQPGDVYVGGAMNLLYGITDILSITDTIVTVRQDIIVAPKGFATTYIYTEYQIVNNIIPSLYMIGDAASAHRWESFLARNQALKDDAEYVEDLSVSGGAGYSYSRTMTKSSTQTQEFELLVDEKLAVDAGLTINGLGITGGAYISTSYTNGESLTNSTVNSTTTGFELKDSDPGDMIALSVKRDKVYGTPVFVTKSGVTSCPHEPGTSSRELCTLSPQSQSQSGISPSSAATFTLSLNNMSETNEARNYVLQVVNASNPHGAVIMVAGQPLSQPVTYTLQPYVALPVTLNVTMPPASQVYDFTGIQIRLRSDCDESVDDTATLDVHFTPPCSPVSIFSPGKNWVLNQAGNGILPVTITGYQLTNPQLQEISLEFSSNSGNTWIAFFSKPKDSIHTNSVLVNWDVSGYDDGPYLLRAVSTCTGNVKNYSEVLPGTIDITPPQVFGLPQPADGILSPGDEISFTFSESLSRASVTINTCKLVDALTGIQVDASVQYNESTRKILFTISPGLSYFIENRYLVSHINGVTDLNGNVAVNASWTFLVDQGPLHWIPDNFEFNVTSAGTFNFTSSLRNTSAGLVPYSVLTPSTLSAVPNNGNLGASGGQVNVNFSTQTVVPGDPHYDTIFASTLGFPEEKVYLSFYTPNFFHLGVGPAEQNVSAEAGTALFQVNSNIAWSVEGNASWLTVSPRIGYYNDTVFVSYTENTTGLDRVAAITVVGEGVPVDTVVTLIQSGIPSTLNLSGHIVPGVNTECYKAMQTITVQNFTVESGASVNMIAGSNIRLMPVTWSKSGSHYHGWISMLDPCGSLPPAMVVSQPDAGLAVGEVRTPGRFFRVFPNPTTGNFTLEMTGADDGPAIRVNIYGMQGERILSTELPSQARYHFSLVNRAPGLYLVQVVSGRESGVVRVIRQ
ncbi:MAG TPA: T9SS type A sorting domain-containing protein, partial [Bacteroidales bacterium]|nr:T9SS type A sorting domain-containing protein [Bacteroidales bacterium]